MTQTQHADIVVVGSGAAGLFASIWAGRAAANSANAPSTRPTIIALDGAKKLGAKILVAGGGRCNVTHHHVDETAYFGSSRNTIRRVLSRFTVQQTIDFFAEAGVTLKREETGKLFPTTDDANTVLNALLNQARAANVHIRHPWRVGRITRDESPTAVHPFIITRAIDQSSSPISEESSHITNSAHAQPTETIHARRLILCTGGMALPKTGSDGLGYTFARTLGHSTTPRIFPALVPLILDDSSFIRSLSGITLPTTLRVLSGTGKQLVAFTNSTLCTHFGLSGPGPLDISRSYFDAKAADPAATLTINWLPKLTTEQLDSDLVNARRLPPLKFFDRPSHHLPERLARALCASVNIDPLSPCDNLPRNQRRALALAVTNAPLPVTGSRGFTYAEVTAGGISLSEIDPSTMQSRLCSGLYLAGEILDVDGRIGGYNFQWAWASGFIAGSSAPASLVAPHIP